MLIEPPRRPGKWLGELAADNHVQPVTCPGHRDVGGPDVTRTRFLHGRRVEPLALGRPCLRVQARNDDVLELESLCSVEGADPNHGFVSAVVLREIFAWDSARRERRPDRVGSLISRCEDRRVPEIRPKVERLADDLDC